MAIPDGHNATRTTRRARSATQMPDDKPGLFFRSLIPPTTVTASVACHLVVQSPKPASSSSNPQVSPTEPQIPASQLVTASASCLTLYTLDRNTSTLRELCTLELYSTIHHLATVPIPNQGRDLIAVVLERSRVVFVEFDEVSCRLRIVGHVQLTNSTSSTRQSRLIATHPRTSMCAVASVSTTIFVFPVICLRRSVSPGKIIPLDVDGVILALDFLDVDDSPLLPNCSSILLALVQRGKDQSITVYTIGEQQGIDGSVGPVVTHIGSMMTCAERPEDLQIARHAAKIGAETSPPVEAHGLSRIPGAPYLFAVFLHGRVVVADARKVVLGVTQARLVRLKQEPTCNFALRLPLPVPSTVVGSSSQIPTVPLDCAQSWDRGGVASDPAACAGTLNSASDTAQGIVPLHTAYSATSPLVPSAGLGSVSYPQPIRPIATSPDPYLSYLFVPSSAKLYYEHSHGAPLTWTSASDHFKTATQYGQDGIYFATDSGALFVLRWCPFERKGGYVIQYGSEERVRSNLSFSIELAGHVGEAVTLAALNNNLLYIANDGGDGSLQRIEAPAVGLFPRNPNSMAQRRYNSDSSATTGHVRYLLEIVQVFLNLSPISDMVVIPPGGVQKPSAPRIGRACSRLRLRARECWASISCSSPRSQPRRRPRSSKSLHSPLSPASDPGACTTGPYSPRSSPGSPLVERVGTSSMRLSEPELLLCCGLQNSGTIRIVKPGAPVTVFSSSSNSFGTCSDIWNVRISAHLDTDTLLVSSFFQSTRVLFSVPPEALLHSGEDDKSAQISHLLDASSASNLLPDVRSLAAGRIDEGLVAQVHPLGVRCVMFLDQSALQQPLSVNDGEVTCPLVKETWDWNVGDGETITTAAVGSSLVFLGIARNGGRSPCLVVLRHLGIPSNFGELNVVVHVELSAELSYICVPEWLDWSLALKNGDRTFQYPVIILGTYTPTLEVWSLEPIFRCSTVSKMQPWSSVSPEAIIKAQCGESFDKKNEQPFGSLPIESTSVGDHCFSNDEGWPEFMKTWSPQQVLESAVMTCVAESISSFDSDGKKWVFVGLRNGTLLRYCLFRNSSRDEYSLKLMSRKRFGDVPVRLFRTILPDGPAFIAQAERPWVSLTNANEPQWVPLAFSETRSWSSYSTRGAERCLAAVCSDDVLRLCGIRNLAPVSVSSIRVGDTPRRVVPLFSPLDTIVVATGCEPLPYVRSESYSSSQPTRDNVIYSELRAFNKTSKRFLGGVRLTPHELVHVLLTVGDLLVVGTSVGLRSVKNFGPLGGCKKGRLLLYSVRPQASATYKSGKGTPWRSKKVERVSFELCSELKLPGAVLAGAVHSNHEMLVISCNNTIIVFGVLKNAIFEVARVAVRMHVISISIYRDVICVADPKDSVSFFRFDLESRGLVRDRTDHRRRLVAYAEIVDNHTSIVTDKMGGLFSLTYEDPSESAESDDGEDSCWSQLYLSAAINCGLIDGDSLSTFGDSINDDASDSVLMQDDHSEEAASDSQANYSDTMVLSNDGTMHDTLLSIGTTANSMMNDDYSEDVEVEEVEGASIVETAGTADVNDIVDVDPDESMGEDTMGEHAGDESHNNVPMEVEVGGNQLVDYADSPGTPPMGAVPMPESPPLQMDIALVPRILVSNHAFRIGDTALRLRKAVFRRLETIEPKDGGKSRKTSFWEDGQSCVLAGTLGGALVCAVPISAGTLTLLKNIAHTLFSSRFQEANFEHYRASYGPRSTGVVDGDLVRQFLALDMAAKRRVCDEAGYTGEGIVMQVEALIHDLCNRVA